MFIATQESPRRPGSIHRFGDETAAAVYPPAVQAAAMDESNDSRVATNGVTHAVCGSVSQGLTGAEHEQALFEYLRRNGLAAEAGVYDRPFARFDRVLETAIFR